jgi:hypothetical protein
VRETLQAGGAPGVAVVVGGGWAAVGVVGGVTPSTLAASCGFALILLLILAWVFVRWAWSCISDDIGYRGPEQDGEVTISIFEKGGTSDKR